jgi:hypothetical protein
MSLQDILTKVLATFGALGLTAICAGGVAYWIFQTLGKGWLDAHFARDLEALKATNVREAERLKADLSRYADRASKFHIREYEVLPEAWGLMNKAYGACHGAISQFQQYSDLDKMTSPQLEAWLEGCGLEDFQKVEIQNTSRKNDKYISFYTWKQISDAQKASGEFQNYVILQGVFIDEDLQVKMAEAGTAMRKALISRSMVERTLGYNAPGQTDFWTMAVEELKPVEKAVQEVKQTIRRRLSDIKAPAGDHVEDSR